MASVTAAGHFWRDGEPSSISDLGDVEARGRHWGSPMAQHKGSGAGGEYLGTGLWI